jgi:hypothetical protein
LRNIIFLEFSFITSPEGQKHPYEDLEVLTYPMIPVSEKTLFLGRFISLALLSFREDQHVSEMRMDALVE